MTDHQKEMKEEVHEILAHSYLVYFAALVAGLLLNIYFPIRILPESISAFAGLFFLLAAPLLIAWAQRTSYKFSVEKKEGNEEINFLRGPYAFTRSPTHVGLNFLLMGFGFLINSLFIVVFSIISFFITRLVFIKKEEDFLEKKYGEDYLDYKKSVKNWI